MGNPDSPVKQNSPSDRDAVEVRQPEFTALRDAGRLAEEMSLDRFLGVRMTVSAELGRVTMSLGELLRLGEGSVVELNRSVTGLVDLVVNGVRVARGEVVVIDDCFAVRIKQIDATAKATAGS